MSDRFDEEVARICETISPLDKAEFAAAILRSAVRMAKEDRDAETMEGAAAVETVRVMEGKPVTTWTSVEDAMPTERHAVLVQVSAHGTYPVTLCVGYWKQQSKGVLWVTPGVERVGREVTHWLACLPGPLNAPGWPGTVAGGSMPSASPVPPASEPVAAMPPMRRQWRGFIWESEDDVLWRKVGTDFDHCICDQPIAPGSTCTECGSSRPASEPAPRETPARSVSDRMAEVTAESRERARTSGGFDGEPTTIGFPAGFEYDGTRIVETPAAPTGTPQSWDDPRLAGDPNKGRTCLHCGGIVPAGTRYQHTNGRCVAAPTGTARDLPSFLELQVLANDTNRECGTPWDPSDFASAYMAITWRSEYGVSEWLTVARRLATERGYVAAPPPPPAEPRAGESFSDTLIGGGFVLSGPDGVCFACRASMHGHCLHAGCACLRDGHTRPTVTPAPAPQPVTPPDAARAIAKMMGKLDDEDKATFNWLCAGVRELKPVSGEVAEVAAAAAAVAWLRGNPTGNMSTADVIEIVERLAREVERLTKERDEKSAHVDKLQSRAARARVERDADIKWANEGYSKLSAEAATFRARVAELEAERDNFERLSETYHRQSLLSSQVIRDTEIERDTLRTRVAELESERADLDAKALAAVESVPTSTGSNP